MGMGMGIILVGTTELLREKENRQEMPVF